MGRGPRSSISATPWSVSIFKKVGVDENNLDIGMDEDHLDMGVGIGEDCLNIGVGMIEDCLHVAVEHPDKVSVAARAALWKQHNQNLFTTPYSLTPKPKSRLQPNASPVELFCHFPLSVWEHILKETN